jgi:mannose-6-phosphate isomerase-like protein (cupin superfamily)
VARTERGEHRVDHERHRRARSREPQATHRFSWSRRDLGQGGVHLSQRRACALDQPTSRVRQRDAARRPGEQYDPELLLELPDRLAHGGPGDPELAGRAREAAQAGDGEERLELGGRAPSSWRRSSGLGQTLIVTSGAGRVQQWGGPVEELRPGDVVWTPPGVKHWHGAAPTTAMTHIAIQESLDGKVVEWMEKVTDEQYEGAKR